MEEHRKGRSGERQVFYSNRLKTRNKNFSTQQSWSALESANLTTADEGWLLTTGHELFTSFPPPSFSTDPVENLSKSLFCLPQASAVRTTSPLCTARDAAG